MHALATRCDLETGKRPEYRAAGVAEDIRCAAGLAQLRAWVEPAGRSAARAADPAGCCFSVCFSDFTKLFHELVQSLFELVHYCRRELRPGKGPVERMFQSSSPL